MQNEVIWPVCKKKSHFVNKNDKKKTILRGDLPRIIVVLVEKQHMSAIDFYIYEIYKYVSYI